MTTACLVIACTNEGGPGGGDGGKPKKLTCRMDKQCCICPDDAAIKK